MGISCKNESKIWFSRLSSALTRTLRFFTEEIRLVVPGLSLPLHLYNTHFFPTLRPCCWDQRMKAVRTSSPDWTCGWFSNPVGVQLGWCRAKTPVLSPVRQKTACGWANHYPSSSVSLPLSIQKPITAVALICFSRMFPLLLACYGSSFWEDLHMRDSIKPRGKLNTSFFITTVSPL